MLNRITEQSGTCKKVKSKMKHVSLIKFLFSEKATAVELFHKACLKDTHFL